MTEADLATRAPENDATADSEGPSAAAAATAPTPIGTTGLSDHCVSDRPTPTGRTTKGEVRKLGDVDTYVSKPSEYPHSPARLLLLLTGGTGVRSTNNQIQADMFADAGYVVVMPDLFDGDVAPNASTTAVGEEGSAGRDEDDAQALLEQQQAASSSSFLDMFKLKAVETVKSFLIDMWLARHTEAKVMPILQRVLAASRDEFADAVAGGGGIYAAGYCFGGRYVLLLGRGDGGGAGGADAGASAAPAAEEGAETETTPTPRPRPAIKAGAVAHATLVSPDDFHGVQAPVSLACVESDPMFPDAVRTAGEDYLSQHNIEHEVQVYPGVPHGFAVVGDYADEAIKTAQATAFEQMLQWLNAH